LRAVDAGGPGRSRDRAAVVIGGHDDGRDVAVACSAIRGTVGDRRCCWAGQQETPVMDVS
jgi:hypothetical protein